MIDAAQLLELVEYGVFGIAFTAATATLAYDLPVVWAWFMDPWHNPVVRHPRQSGRRRP